MGRPWVWIKVIGDMSSKLCTSLTTRRDEATILSATDAQHVVHAVRDEYANYKWLSIPVVGRGRYVVEGMQVDRAHAAEPA
jgi:hypothetical protein